MRLYKYRSLDNIRHVYDIIASERLHCAPYDELNDPFEGWFFSIIDPRKISAAGTPIGCREVRTAKSVRDLHSLVGKRRVCGLSSTLEDVRLWSYYADGHKGIAIEIEIPSETPSLHEVSNVDSLPEYELGLTVLTSLSGPAADELLSFKTKHWEYEKEFRIIQDNEFFPISGCICAVFAGVNGTEDDLAILRQLTPREIPAAKTKMDWKTMTIKSAIT